MKKVLAVALLCTASAFATWDYFPIKEAGKGEAKVGAQYWMQDKLSSIGLNAKARFSVIDGLEIAALFNGGGPEYLQGGFPLTASYDGNSCDDDDVCPPTFNSPAISVRYWLPSGIGIALDVALPFQGKNVENVAGKANLAFTPAVQYSTKLTEELELGSQLSFYFPLENGDKYAPQKELGIGIEVDYSLGSITPYVGVDVALGLMKPTYDGNDAGETATGILPGVGAIFKINDMLAADVGVTFGIGEDYYGEEMPITIGANIAVSF